MAGSNSKSRVGEMLNWKNVYESPEPGVESRESIVSSQKIQSIIKIKIFMGQYKDLLAFKKAYELAMHIFQISKRFPVEERYSLTDQIRRSSRSVCTNLAESYKRRRYKDYFISKLNDSETEIITEL